MKSTIAMLIALTMGPSVSIAETCVSLDFDVVRVDPQTLDDLWPYVDFAAGETVKYGDTIRMKLRGEWTGVYHLWALDAAGNKETDFPAVHSSFGAITLPCGPKNDTQTCPGELPGAPFFIRDTTKGKPGVESEFLVVSYTPCSQKGEMLNGRVLPSCDTLVDPERDMARAYAHIGRKELMEIYRPGKGSPSNCGYVEGPDGMTSIHKTVEIRVTR